MTGLKRKAVDNGCLVAHVAFGTKTAYISGARGVFLLLVVAVTVLFAILAGVHQGGRVGVDSHAGSDLHVVDVG